MVLVVSNTVVVVERMNMRRIIVNRTNIHVVCSWEQGQACHCLLLGDPMSSGYPLQRTAKHNYLPHGVGSEISWKDSSQQRVGTRPMRHTLFGKGPTRCHHEAFVSCVSINPVPPRMWRDDNVGRLPVTVLLVQKTELS